VGLAAIMALSGSIAGTGAASGLTRASGTCVAEEGWGVARDDLAQQVAEIVNRYRAEVGLRPLRISAPLTRSAEWKARHMAHFRYFGHSDPAPPVSRTVFQRLYACGFGSSGSENIAYGYRSARAVVRAWLGSPGHRRNIEMPRWKYMGVGVASTRGGIIFWAQNFGH
jgi:uncharacterized protein YkwD